MRLRLGLLASLVATVVACQCGQADFCENVRCVLPLTCEPATGRCVVPPADGGAGGGTGGAGGAGGASGGGQGGGGAQGCTGAGGCTGATPVCDTAANGGLGRCVVCTVAAGCSGPTPWCEPSAGAAGQCWGCRNVGDCTVAGTVCDPFSHTCVPDGYDGGGGSGGGAGGGSGGTGVVVWDDAGMTAHCLPFDAGTAACTTECSRGFICVAGQCELRGSSGPVQVTLRFPQDEDLDLHVLEPLADAGTCEIWYGNPNVAFDAGIVFPFPLPTPKPCGARGWLDLDSNPACNLDHVRVENVIYPASQPAPLGTYRVRVDYFQNCSASGSVPYEVEVRANGATRYYCGTFQPQDADQGSAGSGRDITLFTVQ